MQHRANDQFESAHLDTVFNMDGLGSFDLLLVRNPPQQRKRRDVLFGVAFVFRSREDALGRYKQVQEKNEIRRRPATDNRQRRNPGQRLLPLNDNNILVRRLYKYILLLLLLYINVRVVEKCNLYDIYNIIFF